MDNVRNSVSIDKVEEIKGSVLTTQSIPVTETDNNTDEDDEEEEEEEEEEEFREENKVNDLKVEEKVTIDKVEKIDNINDNLMILPHLHKHDLHKKTTYDKPSFWICGGYFSELG
eukprot:CAMPEP_0205811316 /NCGR_PEP_ID=MMETSP0205-20121125/15494_1 /ASSEMBLY_ACC=CAM_ASM_000278 /TAXON_ID=36767 /ORGANISM="Euplotes focardii, Strain TN1" /LENGTH=114 /DNA_ID=CAMNT_0053090321 /DNA_START=379 /DNA_END=723 /DNA_ORIENTATION=-